MNAGDKKPKVPWVSYMLIAYLVAACLGFLVVTIWVGFYLPEVVRGISQGIAVLFKAASEGWAAGWR